MNPVKATFDAVDTQFPAGTEAVGFKLTLTAQPGTAVPPADNGTGITQPMTGYTGTCDLVAREITISDVAAGTYVGRIALVDAEGNEVAPGVTDPAPITIVETAAVSFPVPTSLTLTRP